VRAVLPLLCAFILGFGAAGTLELVGLELTGQALVPLGCAFGVLGAVLATRWMRRG